MAIIVPPYSLWRARPPVVSRLSRGVLRSAIARKMSLIPARRWSRQIRMALAFDEKVKGRGNLPVSSRAAAENTSSAPSSVSRRASAGFAEEVQVFSYPGRGFQGSRHALNRICAQAQKPHGHAHGAAMRIGGTLGQRRPPAFKAGRALSTWFRVPAHCGSKALKSPQAHCILFACNAKPKEITPICRAGYCHLHRPEQIAPFQNGFEHARRAVPRR